VETFSAQVGLRLLRKPQDSNWQKVFQVGWKWIPVGLLAALVFVQTAFIVSRILTWTSRFSPSMEQVTGYLLGDHQGVSLFGEITNHTVAGFGDIWRLGLDFLRSGEPLGWGITINLALTVTIGLLYLSWLASWWIQKSNGEKSP
jgi:hypothetical protein